MNCIQAIVTLVFGVFFCIFSLKVRTNAIGVYSFNKIEPPGGCIIVRETNPTGYPDDVGDTGKTNDADNLIDGDAADDKTKVDTRLTTTRLR